MMEKIVIFGTADFARIAYYFFTEASDYEVVGFTVHKEQKKEESLFGLPVVDFETARQSYPTDKFKMFVAVAQSKLNRVRAQVYEQAKELGYTLVSYIHPGVQHWSNVTIGDNSFIFDGCTINPFATIGNNVIIWSGTVIGHHSVLEDHCFIAGHVVVSGHVRIGSYSYLGVNATIRDNVRVGSECMIGAAALIMRNTKDRQLFAPERSRAAKMDTYQLMGLD